MFRTDDLRKQLDSLQLSEEQKQYFTKMLDDIDEVGKAVQALYKKYPELGAPYPLIGGKRVN